MTAVLLVFINPLALRRTIYMAIPILSIIGGSVLLNAHRTHAVIAEQIGGFDRGIGIAFALSLIHISEPTRLSLVSRMPSSA